MVSVLKFFLAICLFAVSATSLQVGGPVASEFLLSGAPVNAAQMVVQVAPRLLLGSPMGAAVLSATILPLLAMVQGGFDLINTNVNFHVFFRDIFINILRASFK
jgi:hypothetical protein